MSGLDDWSPVTDELISTQAAPPNVHGAYTCLEWCHMQSRWMQQRGISARVVETGLLCFIETKPRR